MSTAPVIVFAYNRPVLLREALRTLAANDIAAASDLHIFCDGPKPGAPPAGVSAIDEVRAVAHGAQGFRSVTVIEAPTNKGLARSVIDGVTRIIAVHGRAIIVEDDVVLSPHFLRFMNEALDAYADDGRVFGIGAWNYFAPEERIQRNFFLRYPDSQAWATWKRAWDRFEPDGKALLDHLERTGKLKAFDGDGRVEIYSEMLRAQVEGHIDSWAIRWTASCIAAGGLCYYPRVSLLRNKGIGHGGTHETGNDHNAELPIAAAPVPVERIDAVESQEALALWTQYAQAHFIGRNASLKTRIWRKLPPELRQWWARRNSSGASPEQLAFEPVSRAFGFDRGQPIDRYYIEGFLSSKKECITGHVMEIGEDRYTRRFGSGVAQSEVLHFQGDAMAGQRIGDLTRHESLPHGAVDAFICTQTLNFIFDVRAAIEGLHRSLRPGGTALVTVAGLCQISRHDADRWGDFWRFTPQGIERLFAEAFGSERITVRAFGNSYAATCLLKGFAAEECDARLLDAPDPDYPVVIGISATKA
ncbi:MAG: hypothetical protein IPK70_09405 [Flavobacteriales bacterium]|jgi:SAM-dependent methyltransferase|nr:hypothetical protein [Flavobacteriales bacterium]